ncbi:MAG: DJ-1/PfpI family protein [Oscillospiraceae bacterium]|nr:DJ-1/PfpI family protein [Oscillospiraceae bacterium]
MIYIFLAEGFEELEVIAPRDILKRSKFVVKMVGCGQEMVTSTLGLTIKTDIQIENSITRNLEAIVLPGGMPGTEKLNKCEKVHEIIKFCMKENILIGAICAAPTILGKMGLLKNKYATCFPGCENDLQGAILSQDSVCQDGNIITSKGPGTAMEFGFSLVNYLKSELSMQFIKKSMHYSAT